MNTLSYFLLYQSCRSLRDISFGGPQIPFLSLIERSYRDRLIMMTSSESHLFSFASGPPNPKSTALYTSVIKQPRNGIPVIQAKFLTA